MKIALITNILAPYRNPLYEAMETRFDDVSVLLMATHENNRLWQLGDARFRTLVLPGLHFKPRGAETPMHINYRVMRTLNGLDPDVVLSGGFTLANLSAL